MAGFLPAFQLQEKLKLIEEVTASLQQEVEERPLHGIMEFEGMGKKVWEGIDVEAYLNEERNSWD